MKKMMPKIAAFACALSIFGTSSASALQNPSAWAVTSVQQAAWLNTPNLSVLEATEPITRAEFCQLAVNIYAYITSSPTPVTESTYFTDCFEPSVNAAYELGLVQGRGDGIFAPDEAITRQDLCVLLNNIAMAVGDITIGADYLVDDYVDGNEVREYATDAMQMMLEREVISGIPTTQADGVVRTLLAPTQTATREQALILADRFASPYEPWDTDVDTYIPEDDIVYGTVEDTNASDSTYDIASIPQTTADKMTFLFGEGNDRYDDEETAYNNTTVVTIPVWTHNSAGETVSSTRDLRVHVELAPIVEAIFAEIYASDERIPIISIGGWAWRSYERSEHRQGTAIDINWEQNMECNIDADGNVTEITCGTLWEPYDNPYSIPADSDIVAIFKKYGFSWGGDAWTSKRDYMHFSFMGT